MSAPRLLELPPAHKPSLGRGGRSRPHSPSSTRGGSRRSDWLFLPIEHGSRPSAELAEQLCALCRKNEARVNTLNKRVWRVLGIAKPRAGRGPKARRQREAIPRLMRMYDLLHRGDSPQRLGRGAPGGGRPRQRGHTSDEAAGALPAESVSRGRAPR